MRFNFNSRTWWLLVVVVTIVLAGVLWIVRERRDQNDQPMTPDAMTAVNATSAADNNPDEMAGMDMSTNGEITLSANQLRTFGVTFGTVDVRTLTQLARATGRVVADESRVVQVAARVNGFVEKLYVNVTGQPVRRGQPMFDLYAPELLAAQQELLLAVDLQRTIGATSTPGMPASSTDLVAAARRRLLLWDIDEQQIDKVIQSREVRRTLSIIAPASGIVTERNIIQGQAISAGQTLFTITDLSRVWVEIELRGADAHVVQERTPAQIVIDGLDTPALNGRVEYVYPTVDNDTRTTRARVALANNAGLLRPGMYATVLLSTPSRTVLTVPNTAVVHTGTRTLVFVDMGGGRLAPQAVISGMVAGDYTEVLQGLEPGQRVVTSAQFLLDSESNLAEIMKGMIGMGGSTKNMGGMDMGGADTGGMKMSPPPPSR